jgi:hypothetical protein
MLADIHPAVPPPTMAMRLIRREASVDGPIPVCALTPVVDGDIGFRTHSRRELSEKGARPAA